MLRKRITEKFISLILASAALSLSFAYAGDSFHLRLPKPHDIDFSKGVRINFPKDSLKLLLQELEKTVKIPLEKPAIPYLVVVTPSEAAILRQHLQISDWKTLAKKTKLSEKEFVPECFKKSASYMKNGAVESYIVAGQAPDLQNYRRELWRLYLVKGGKSDEFNWKRWKPHVLVGTTSMKLHDDDHPHREPEAPCLEL